MNCEDHIRLIRDHEVTATHDIWSKAIDSDEEDRLCEEAIKKHLEECRACQDTNEMWHSLDSDDERWLEWVDLLDGYGVIPAHKKYYVTRYARGFPDLRKFLKGKKRTLKHHLEWLRKCMAHIEKTTTTTKEPMLGFEIWNNPYHITNLEEYAA